MSRVSRDPEPQRPEPGSPPRTEPRPDPGAPRSPAVKAPPPTNVVRVGRMGVNRNVAIIAGVVLLAIVLVFARAAGKKDTKVEIPFEPVARRDISLTVEATGT